jgi:hypothetical protein
MDGRATVDLSGDQSGDELEIHVRKTSGANMMTSMKHVLSVLAVSACLAMPAMAQFNPGQGQQGQGQGGFGQGGQGQGRGGFDPTQMRQQQAQQMKEELGASDEEWAVLQPKIEKVTSLQADAGGGVAGIAGMLGRLGRGAGGGGGGGGRTNMMSALRGLTGMSAEMSAALEALNTAMDNPNANDQLIKERLNAVRTLRAKAKVDLEAARKDLIELLTQRQEAILFQRGLIE